MLHDLSSVLKYHVEKVLKGIPDKFNCRRDFQDVEWILLYFGSWEDLIENQPWFL